MSDETLSSSPCSVGSVRRALCTQLSQLLNGDTVCVRIRLYDQSQKVRFSSCRDHVWHEFDRIFEPSFFLTLQGELDLLAIDLAPLHRRLATTPPSPTDAELLAIHRRLELLQVRQQIGTDWKETEFTFNRKAIKPYRNIELGNYLHQLLFHDQYHGN